MGDERCHINLFNDYTASIYVNGKCKHRYIRPFLRVKVHKPVLYMNRFSSPSALASLLGFITFPKCGYDWL